MLVDWENKLAIDYYDKYGDPIPVQELPGFVGSMWDGEVMLDASLGKSTQDCIHISPREVERHVCEGR